MANEKLAVRPPQFDLNNEAVSAARRAQLTVRVSPKVTPKDISRVLERIYELSGCLACGFLGFDVIFRNEVINPALAGLSKERFDNIAGFDVLGG